MNPADLIRTVAKWTSPESALAERRPRIVVAEDNEAIRELIVTRLELAGYQTFVARDGYEALEAIQQVRPHAVVLDVGMPRLDGFGVLKALQLVRRATPPVLILTARSGREDVRTALALGARDYLAKPFDGARLLARVARLLQKRGSLKGGGELDIDGF